MNYEQRIQVIIDRFSDADKEMIAERVEQALPATKCMAPVESGIMACLMGYFSGGHAQAVMNTDDIQIAIDELVRDVAYKTAAREYAVEIDNHNVEGKQDEL